MINVFDILEIVEDSQLFSNEFHEVMYNHALSKLESGTASDLIKLYEMYQRKYPHGWTLKKFAEQDVLNRMKDVLVQEIDDMPIHHIAKYLDFYQKDYNFCKFILSKCIEKL